MSNPDFRAGIVINGPYTAAELVSPDGNNWERKKERKIERMIERKKERKIERKKERNKERNKERM